MQRHLMLNIGPTELSITGNIIFNGGFGLPKGGAILVQTGTLRMQDVSFIFNSAGTGGAIYAAPTTQIVMKNIIFESNSAVKGTRPFFSCSDGHSLQFTGDGGALCLYDASIVVVIAQFNGNTATGFLSSSFLKKE